MKYKSVKIFEVNMAAITKIELKKWLANCFNSEDRFKVAKVNSEFILRSLKDGEFRKTLNNFDLNIADGSGVLWTAKYLQIPLIKMPVISVIQAIGQMIYSGASLVFYPKYCTVPIPERFPGVTALKLMISVAQDSGAPVYFLGAEEEINKKAVDMLKKEFPKLIIAGRHHGYFQDNARVVEEINKSKAKLLIVAFGSPKQEYWIRDNMPKLLTVRVAVGEGGSLDRISGEFKQAPRWMRKVGAEWLWRIFSDRSKSETGHRTKRVFRAVPVFIYETVRYKINNNSSNNQTSDK